MAFDIRTDDEEFEEFDEYDDVKQPSPPKFYRRRKFWICCIPTTIIAIVVAVILALYVIMPKIAQGLMNKASINLSQIDITNPTATSMDIVMVGEMQNTGPFHADITFPGTVYVSWEGIELGTTEIPGTSKAAGGHGDLNLQSTFTITNATGFTEFSSYMLNAETFVWHLEGKLNVKALGHTVKDLDLKKDITVNAFRGLSGIFIQKFSLPGDDPAGKGIIIEIDTGVTNPSSIQMFMGSLTLAISYKNTLMGYVTSSNLTMVRGAQTLSMKGLLIPQTTAQGLADVSEMMSRYIGNVVTDTIATGYEVKPDGINTVDWLSAAVKNLKLTVPLQSPQPLQLIKALNLGALGLVFTPGTAYQPITTSTGVMANYTLPDGFGFGVQFTQVANSFALSRNDVPIANINSSYNPSTSNMAAGTLTFDLLQTPLVVPDASHQPFQEFNRDLTVGSNLGFNVVGFASVFANTSIGTVNLVNIPFNASTDLSGLQSLANPAPTITELQVVSGTPTALTMAITVVIVNPSSISLSAGDIVLDLTYKGVRLGTVTMPALAIVPGANTVNASSTIDPAASPEGLELLTLYTSGAGATVSIVGTPSSTAVESLTLAFGALNIQSQMPGLQSKLLAGASLVVLDTTLANGLAQTVVTVNNPFVPPMSILSIDSKITYNGAVLGTVVSTFASPPVIPGTGQGSITASLAMNTNPDDLTHLIKTQAEKNGLDTKAFDALLALKNGGNPDPNLFNGFNVADFVIKAMAGLSVDITMTTTVKVGDYQVTMPYTQTGVTTTTDQTILKLIPIVGTPIAQLLVERSKLAFDSIKILSPGETSFQTDIVGAITDTGPLDAQIQFPNPVTISYGGKAIGTMMMPTVNAVAGKGAQLNLVGVPFTVTDVGAFTEFNIYALNNEKFEWTISTTGLIVNAMGASLPGVTMTKVVTLDGFNKLAGLQLTSYIITNIDSAGLHMVISATLANPSTIGMTIPVSIFNTQFHGKVLGPATAQGLTLVPHATSSFALNATIAAGNGDLKPILSAIFQNALGGIATDLDAQGAGAPGVSWLDAAIKTLLLHTSLPPLTDPPITSVTIDSMSMDFSCGSCVWEPTSVSTITAKTKLPFANGAPIVQLSQNVEILDKNGQVVGSLNTPYAPATAVGDTVTTTTPPAPLVVASGAHEVYQNFIGDLNHADSYELGLRGTTNSILDLGALGQIEVKGIKLDVRSSLAGLQGLKDVKYVTLLSVDISKIDSMDVTTIVNIKNPSKLSLTLGDISLKVGLDTTAAGFAGYSYLRGLTLVPGSNEVVANVIFDKKFPAGSKIATDLYSKDVAVTMYGYPGSSSNPALAAGLATLQSSVTIPATMPSNQSAPAYSNLWTLTVPDSIMTDNQVELTTTFNNPFFALEMRMLDPVPDPSYMPPDPFISVFDSRTNYWNPTFSFVNNFKYTLKAGQSTTMTIKVPVTGISGVSRPFLEGLVREAAVGNLKITVMYTPIVSLGSDPSKFMGYFASDMNYPPDGVLGLKAGADISKLLQWFDNKYNKTAVLPPPANTTTTVTQTLTPTDTISTTTTTAIETTTTVPTTTAVETTTTTSAPPATTVPSTSHTETTTATPTTTTTTASAPAPTGEAPPPGPASSA
ncbi:hypothetical protein B0O80DRAFT_418570 [Mortierella sp. GBAus27b]|nr:hypothetical protein BGX31_007626 [Mortierella sp. GBA43]KAI8347834.1 hypothetical protein B0O80DRAFT_418570 [Mortierella sp. GBAus27b]